MDPLREAHLREVPAGVGWPEGLWDALTRLCHPVMDPRPLRAHRLSLHPCSHTFTRQPCLRMAFSCQPSRGPLVQQALPGCPPARSHGFRLDVTCFSHGGERGTELLKKGTKRTGVFSNNLT